MLRRWVLVEALVSLAFPALARASDPSPVALPATNVTQTSATLRGTVDAHGAPTRYRFRYDNGSILHQFDTITRDAGSGTGPVAVQVQLGGLDPGTTYNVSVVAVRGDDEEFVSNTVAFTTPGFRDSRSCRVPNLRGVRADNVFGKLLPLGCAIGKVHKRRGTHCVTRLFLTSCSHAWVVAQSPKPGSHIPTGGKIVVTLGPKRPGKHKRRQQRHRR
jgi:Fibronectin type III domain